jgi:hypothetical protein
MQKVSRQTAVVEDVGILEDRSGELEGYTVNFLTFRRDIDHTPLMQGLPDDRCQCPHWSYVVKGRVTYRLADHDLVVEAGDAFHLPPGHIPVANEPGTEIIQFSPTHDLHETQAVLRANAQRLMGVGRPG